MAISPLTISFCTLQRPRQISGVDTWIKSICLELKSTGHHPHILSITHGQGEFPLMEFAKKFNVEYDQIQNNDHESLESLLKTILVVLKTRKTDAFLPGYCTPAFFLTPYLSNANIPSVLVLHSDDERYRTYFDEFVAKPSKYRVHGVVAVSDYLYGWFDQVHDFDFPKTLIEYGVHVPKNQKEYFHEIKRCIRNKPIHKPNKKEIYEMVYCNYIHDETEHDLIAKRVQLKELMDDDGKDTTALRVFIRKFNKLFL